MDIDDASLIAKFSYLLSDMEHEERETLCLALQAIGERRTRGLIVLARKDDHGDVFSHFAVDGQLDNDLVVRINSEWR